MTKWSAAPVSRALSILLVLQNAMQNAQNADKMVKMLFFACYIHLVDIYYGNTNEMEQYNAFRHRSQ